MTFADLASSADYPSVCEADIFPELGVVDEVALPLSDSAEELVKARPVVKLVEQMDEEVHITCSVDEVSAGTFILGTPDLDGHCFREDLLGKFVLCGYCGGRGVFLVVVDDTCGLLL